MWLNVLTPPVERIRRIRCFVTDLLYCNLYWDLILSSHMVTITIIEFCFAPLTRCFPVENHIPPEDPVWCHESTPESSVQCCEEDFCNTKDNYVGTLPGEKNKNQQINQYVLLELVLLQLQTNLYEIIKRKGI